MHDNKITAYLFVLLFSASPCRGQDEGFSAQPRHRGDHALVIYASLSRSGVEKVTYVPAGMSSEHAALLRKNVQLALNGG